MTSKLLLFFLIKLHITQLHMCKQCEVFLFLFYNISSGACGFDTKDIQHAMDDSFFVTLPSLETKMATPS